MHPLKIAGLLYLSLTAGSGLHASTASYFYGDSYAGDTRYTVTKLFDGNDDTLCWAAAASSILYYWQNSYAAYLPTGTPTGSTASRSIPIIFSTPSPTVS